MPGVAPSLLTPLLAIAATGIALSAWLVRRVILLAVMDVPGARSAHDRPTPRGGGIGMVAVVLLAVPACLALLPGPGSRALQASLLLCGVLLLAAVSWLDDLRQFGAGAKFAAQCAAAILAVAAAATDPLAAGWSAGALACFCVVGFCWLMLCTNAVNFMDGLNGLAAGVCAICGLFAFGLGLSTGCALLAASGLMLAAGLLGFLPFNFPSARIFMGDVGSQTAGLLAGSFALLLLAGTGSPARALAMPLILGGLLADVAFTLCRRLLRRERITQAHRGHLYQVAARSGLTPATVTLWQWGFALWGGMVGLALLPMRPLSAATLVLLPQLAWGLTVRHRAKRAGLGRWS